MNEILRDAMRYRRLRVLGAAVHNTKNLEQGTVSCFTNLDEIVDQDIKAVPSRGEAKDGELNGLPVGMIDRKFIILAINPVNGKVYDESNSLLLCAKDAAVPAALAAYVEKCEKLDANPEHVESVWLLHDRVLDFQKAAGGGRVPDTVGDEIPRCLYDEGADH